MAISPFDSALYRDLFSDREIAALFTDSAEVRAMMIVEGALAKVQGEAGLIPEISGLYIHRCSLELAIDPGGLAAETGRSAVPVPALVAAFRKAMEAPEHAQFVHWGATSQDIMDTALALRLRQVITLYEARLKAAIQGLGALAQAHADLPMAGRTYGQVATPTSFGAVVASWGAPLIRHAERLDALKPRLLNVSLSGAAGTLSAIENGADIRAALAKALGLGDPGASWHSERDCIGEFAAWMAGLATTLAKMGEDLTLMSQSGIGEITLGASGGSSTMPQKANPVMPSVLVALGRQAQALAGAISGAGIHRQQRDGAAWFVEWLNLPQICAATGRALEIATELSTSIAPNEAAMALGIDPDDLGLIYAEALSFALARKMRRPDAQAAVKELCLEARKTGQPLEDLTQKRFGDHDLEALFTPANQLGEAPQTAREFAKRAKAL